MNEYRDEALAILHEFKDSEVRKALEQLVRYTTDRKYQPLSPKGGKAKIEAKKDLQTERFSVLD